MFWDIFINTDDIIYVPYRSNGHIIILSMRNIKPTKNISSNLSNPLSLFVATSGDIYVDAYISIGGVIKWTLNSTIGVPIMYACNWCWDLFVDVSNTLYCSMYHLHQVVTKSLNSYSNAFSTVAGIRSTRGSASNMLDNPLGIFVDVNFDLYVADTSNNRIQLFPLGELYATTVAGSGSSTTTITLNHPTAVVLDADKYLFIVDSGNHRIVGSGPTGFRCIVGCSKPGGSAANQLFNPLSLSFDSYGNMFVTDPENHRIQKFILSTNSCSKLLGFQNFF